MAMKESDMNVFKKISGGIADQYAVLYDISEVLKEIRDLLGASVGALRDIADGVKTKQVEQSEISDALKQQFMGALSSGLNNVVKQAVKGE